MQGPFHDVIMNFNIDVRLFFNEVKVENGAVRHVAPVLLKIAPELKKEIGKSEQIEKHCEAMAESNYRRNQEELNDFLNS